MKNKSIFLILPLMLVLLLTGASCTQNEVVNQPINKETNNAPINEVVNNQPVNQTLNQPANNLPTDNPIQDSNNKIYTLAEVAKHNLENDCWIIINNNVYNVTTYIAVHPGGPGLKKYCGQDATAIFNSKSAHQTDKANKDLNSLLLGSLQQ